MRNVRHRVWEAWKLRRTTSRLKAGRQLFSTHAKHDGWEALSDTNEAYLTPNSPNAAWLAVEPSWIERLLSAHSESPRCAAMICVALQY
ncbi:MAG: hypothetical protein Q9206_004444 [Seirophora lacunosa]